MTYNHGRYIEQAIQGALNQHTNFPLEIVVGDDFSTDDTKEKVLMYARKHTQKIKFLDRPIGGEYQEKRNRLGRLYNFVDIMNNCSGKYIALLDGDDYWTDSLKLQKQVDFLEANSEYSMCFHAVDVLKDGLVINQIPFGLTKDTFTTTDLVDRWFYPTCSIVFRRSAITAFPKWFTEVASGDMALVHVLSKSGKIKYLDEKMGVYRLHGGGISNTHGGLRKVKDMRIMLSQFDKYFDFKYHWEFNKGIARQIRHYFATSTLPISWYIKWKLSLEARYLDLPPGLKNKLVFFFYQQMFS